MTDQAQSGSAYRRANAMAAYIDRLLGRMPSTAAGLVNAAIPGQPLGGVRESWDAADRGLDDFKQEFGRGALEPLDYPGMVGASAFWAAKRKPQMQLPLPEHPVHQTYQSLARDIENLKDVRIHREPVNVYHGTPVVFDKFDLDKTRHMGIHAGTLGQARMFSGHEGGIHSSNSKIFPMYLGPPDRPFASMRVPDLGSWNPTSLAGELSARGVVFTPAEWDRLERVRQWPNKTWMWEQPEFHQYDPARHWISDSHAYQGAQLNKVGSPRARHPGYDLIGDVLNANKIDALRYVNDMEKPGEMSWIVWNPGMLWKRPTGEQLFGVAGAGAAGAGALSTSDILSQYYGDN